MILVRLYQLKNMKTTQHFVTLSLLTFCCSCLTYAQSTTFKTEEAKLITSDITNFWRMYDELPKAESAEDSTRVLHEFYLNKASTALLEYFEIERKGNNKNIEEEYLFILRQYPKYLASIRGNTEGIQRNKDKIYKYFAKAKKLYPDFSFQDTYFCIGFFNSGGRTMQKGGLYIGTEIFALFDNVVLDEWEGSAWLQFFTPITHIHNIVLHEQAHFQQSPPINNDYNLLYQAINEGAAVFLVDLVTNGEGVTNGGGFGQRVLDYGEINEEKIWNRFKQDMYGYDQSDWLYNAGAEDWPKDLGYYVGYKICRHYYDQANDKKQALKEVFEVADAQKLLEKSDYSSKF